MRFQPIIPTARSALFFLLLGCGAPGEAAFLSYVEAIFDGQTQGMNTVDGLDGANSVAVSPDGKHVYVGSYTDDAVAVFSRDMATGKLTWVQSRKDGGAGVNGLNGVEEIALSPDGGHLYVAGLLDNAVAVFSRDAASGALTFVEAELDGAAGVNGLAGAHSVDVSPDGKHVYAAGRFDDALAVFSRNAVTGALTFVEAQVDAGGGVDGLLGATSARVSPDGKHVYGAGLEERKLGIFSRNSVTGQLSFVGAVDDGMGFEADLDIDDARALTVSPDGKYVYLANHIEDTGDSWVSMFSRNATTGALTPITPALKASDLDTPCFLGIETDSQMAISPDGAFAYVNHGFESAIAAFSRSAASGRLTLHEALCDDSIGEGPDPMNMVDGLWGGQGVAVSPDGEHVYVASSNVEDAVAVFAACTGADSRDLVLANNTVGTTESFTACNAITFGPNYSIITGGDVTAQTGVEMIFTDGFSVAEGGRFVARIAAP